MQKAKRVATKKQTVEYRQGSAIARLYEILSTGKEFDVKELAKKAGKNIAGPLARLERHGKSGRMGQKWTLIREGHTVRLVIKANRKAVSSTTAGPQPAPAPNSTDKPA